MNYQLWKRRVIMKSTNRQTGRSSFPLTAMLLLLAVMAVNIIKPKKVIPGRIGSTEAAASLRIFRGDGVIKALSSRKMKLSASSSLLRLRNIKSVNSSSLLFLILLLAGDVELNPGPEDVYIFPCGHCNRPVTWSQQGVCCDDCSIWFHLSCGDSNLSNYSDLESSKVNWYCFRCNSLNVQNFTYNSSLLQTSNRFDCLNSSTTLEENFSPLHTSTPAKLPDINNESRHSRTFNLDDSTSRILKKKPSSRSNIRLLTINCRSIRGHKSEFKCVDSYTKPDIICGTESWLFGIKPGKPVEDDAILSSEVFPKDLIVHRNDRNEDGGGVFTASRNDLVVSEHTEAVTNCEIIWSKIKLKQCKDLYLASFYMPHRNLDDIKNLDESLSKLSQSKKSKHIILAGDFNCPSIDWDTLTVKPGAPDREVQQALLDVTSQHGLTQIHRTQTRQGNVLDLVFTNNPTLVRNSESLPGISDHCMIVTDIYVKPITNHPKPRKIFLFKKAKWDAIKKDIESVVPKLQTLNQGDADINEMWTELRSCIEKTIENNVPSKTIKKKNNVPWFNHKLKQLTRKKQKLFNSAKVTKNWTEYRKHQKLCKKEFRDAENDFINQKILDGLSKNNTKPFWKYVKSKKTDSCGIPPLKKGNTLISEDREKAKILIEQFKSVFTPKNDRPLPEMEEKFQSPLPELKITKEGVEKLLLNVNTSKSSGPDNIPNIVLKSCAKELAPSMTLIFQKSINSGELPEDWLKANVSPIFKKGNIHLPGNYRPVSLTSVSCKLLEHIICRHLLSHLEKNNILSDLNHGFRSGYSCDTQLLTTMNDLLQNQEQDLQTDVMVLDFSKAFDTCPHDELLYKLDRYGIKGPILSWLRVFLTKRSMKVVINGEESPSVSVDSGVPQGTVLGPILFLCHVNDLPESIKSQVRLFADDCLLYRPIRSLQDHHILQEDLKQLEKWADKWGMRFNATKCYTLSINQKCPYFYDLNEKALKHVDKNPYLGVILSNDLQWENQISKLKKKANSTLSFLKRNMRSCPEECRKLAYISLVRSKLEHGAAIWDPYLAKDIEVLEKVQRSGVRFVTGDYRSRDEGCVTRMLDKMNLTPLHQRRKVIRLSMLYKISNNLLPSMKSENFLVPSVKGKRPIKLKVYEDCEQFNILDKHLVKNNKGYSVKDRIRSVQYENSFFVRTIIEWNHLDNVTVFNPTVEGFKRSLLKSL